MLDNKLSSCENIVTLVKDIASSYLSTTEELGCFDEEEIISDMHECIELCDKLLMDDYFRESEQFLESKSNDVFSSNLQPYKKWLRLYNKEVDRKKKDLSRLLKIVVRNIEDI